MDPPHASPHAALIFGSPNHPPNPSHGILFIHKTPYRTINTAIEHARTISDNRERFEFQKSIIENLVATTDICLQALTHVFDYIKEDGAYLSEDVPDLMSHFPDNTDLLLEAGKTIRNRAGEGFQSLQQILQGNGQRADHLVEFLALETSKVWCNPIGRQSLQKLLHACLSYTTSPDSAPFKNAVLSLNYAIFSRHEKYRTRTTIRSNQSTQSALNYVLAKDTALALELWGQIERKEDSAILQWRPSIDVLVHMNMKYHVSGVLEGGYPSTSKFPLFEDEPPDFLQSPLNSSANSIIAPISSTAPPASIISSPAQSFHGIQPDQSPTSPTPIGKRTTMEFRHPRSESFSTNDPNLQHTVSQSNIDASTNPRSKRQKQTTRDTTFTGDTSVNQQAFATIRENKRLQQENLCECYGVAQFKTALINLGTPNTIKPLLWSELQHIITLIDPPSSIAYICSVHTQRLAEYMSLDTSRFAPPELLSRIRDVAQLCHNDTDLVRAWASNKTRTYFIQTPQVQQAVDNHNLGSLRTAPRIPLVVKPPLLQTTHPSPPLPPNHTTAHTNFHLFDLNDVINDGFVSKDHLVQSDICSKWFQDPQLGPIFMAELAMARFHMRLQQDNPCPRMYHAQHSLLAQAIRCCPTFWEANYRLRNDNNHRLLAYPVAPTYLPPGKDTAFLLYEGHNQLSLNDRQHIVKDYIMVTEQTPGLQISPSRHPVNAISARPFSGLAIEFSFNRSSPSLPEIFDYSGLSIFPNQAAQVPKSIFAAFPDITSNRAIVNSSTVPGMRDLTDQLLLDHCHYTYPWQHAQVLWEKSGVTTLIRWDPTPQHRWMFSTGFLAMNPQHQQFLENGVSCMDVITYHKELDYPPRDQFGVRVVGQGPVFPAVSLLQNGLSYPISRALLGDLSWDYRTVSSQVTTWLTGSRAEVEKAADDWFHQLKPVIILAWKSLQQLEQAAFAGSESYFRSLALGISEHPTPIDDHGLFNLPPRFPTSSTHPDTPNTIIPSHLTSTPASAPLPSSSSLADDAIIPETPSRIVAHTIHTPTSSTPTHNPFPSKPVTPTSSQPFGDDAVIPQTPY